MGLPSDAFNGGKAARAIFIDGVLTFIGSALILLDAAMGVSDEQRVTPIGCHQIMRKSHWRMTIYQQGIFNDAQY